jgi:uncharacterized protein HemY
VPKEAAGRNTLGVTLYRAGEYREAVGALEERLRLGAGQTDGYDLFFLAMCHHRLGDAEKARDCLDRAVRWREGKQDLTPRWAAELAAFRAEAERTLGLKK